MVPPTDDPHARLVRIDGLRRVVPLVPASWHVLVTGCESLAVPLPAISKPDGGATA